MASTSAAPVGTKVSASVSGLTKPSKVGVAMDDDDIVRAKQDFDVICDKYNFRSDEMSSKLADFLTAPRASEVETSSVAEQFGMTMEDANKFMIWIQIGTGFKRDVIDKNAEMMGSQG